MDYKSKYLKYKNKYESLKSQIGGQPKIVKKSSDQNDDKNINIDQIKPYADLFYSYLNHDNDQIRYDDVQFRPQAGRIIERLVEDIIDLKITVKKLEKKIDDNYHEVQTTGVGYFNNGQKRPIPDHQSTVEKVPVDGPKIVQGEGQNKDKCQFIGGEVVSVNLDGGKNPKFGIVDYVDDGIMYAYFGNSIYPESYDCNLFFNYDQRYLIYSSVQKNKYDVASEYFGWVFWTDELGERPLALKKFIEKHKLIMPRKFKSGFEHLL